MLLAVLGTHFEHFANMNTASQRAREELIRQAAELLASESTLVLATCDAANHPYATSVFYLPAGERRTEAAFEDRLDLAWLSSPSSLHSQHLKANPHVSLALHRSTFEWKQIAGVQMRGFCSTLSGDERLRLLALYRQRFHLGTVLGLAIRQSTLYRFHPTWLRLIDNRRGFGWKAEISLADAHESAG